VTRTKKIKIRWLQTSSSTVFSGVKLLISCSLRCRTELKRLYFGTCRHSGTVTLSVPQL
jgi:hypothetical protein